jgi:hypothetical protein
MRGVAGAGGVVVRDLRVGQPYTVTARLPDHAVVYKHVTPAQGASTVALEVQALSFLELDSQPSGADVEIDGKRTGTTPLRVALTPGATVAIKVAKPGYHAASTSVQVPPRGQRAQLTQPLERDDNLVPVRLVSTPPGAEVLRAGAPSGGDRTYTPAEVFVEAGKPQHFTLSMPQRRPLVIEPFVVERGQQGVEKGGPLVAAER